MNFNKRAKLTVVLSW